MAKAEATAPCRQPVVGAWLRVMETDASGVIWETPRNETDWRVMRVNRTGQHLDKHINEDK